MISTGVNSFNCESNVDFIDKLLDNTLIVINSIRQIILILTIFVLILLFNCLNTNIFVSFKYTLFLDCIIFNINPDKDQNIPTVPTIPIKIGFNNLSAVRNSYTPPVTK